MRDMSRTNANMEISLTLECQGPIKSVGPLPTMEHQKQQQHNPDFGPAERNSANGKITRLSAKSIHCHIDSLQHYCGSSSSSSSIWRQGRTKFRVTAYLSSSFRPFPTKLVVVVVAAGGVVGISAPFHSFPAAAAAAAVVVGRTLCSTQPNYVLQNWPARSSIFA